MENILYRRATKRDIDSLVALRQQQLQEEGATATMDMSSTLTQYFSENIGSPRFIYWVATADNEIIGTSGICFYQLLPYYQNPTGYIGQIVGMYTKPQFQRRKIGSSLLTQVIQEAKKSGCSTVRVSASTAGTHLYSHLGFFKKTNLMEYIL